MKQVFLLRHGETEWNVAQEMQLRLASPLTENGKRQPDKNGRLLKKHGCLECLCASPSGRTLETAYTVNAYAQAELVTREELMERDMGDWSRLTLVTHGVMSKVILTYYLGLAPQPVHSLRHPNNLAYRLTFHANAIETHYFLDGTEACEGLYRLQQTAEVKPIRQ